MDGLSALGTLASIFKSYGPWGMFLAIWYFETRFNRKIVNQNHEITAKLIAKYREDTMKILSDHKQFMVDQKEYMKEIQRNYESNVKLVRFYEVLATQLKDVVTLNTQAMTRISDDVNRNQYCPMVRVEKKQIGVKTHD